tara:strand:- start:7051 stop:7266 length:216 start_codon:yes stop_codon:yes gene_type:complete
MKELSLDFYTKNPEGIIDSLNDHGYDCVYTTNGQWAYITYPNYKEADDIACDWVGVDTMIEFNPDHKYLTK